MTTAPSPARNPLGSMRPSSARALLLVMIGEFAWPAGQPAWSSTLLSGLSEFDIEPNAARKALHRIAATGVMTSRREGNRVRWSVTPKGDHILRSGWERTYGWHDRDTAWDGRWLVLSVTVPESQRKLRHHLQSRLLWAGLGSPAPGEWLTPHAERGEQVARIVRDLGLADQAHSFTGELGPLGDPLRIVGAAWDLDDLGQDYRSFIDAYAHREPRTDQEHFRARVELVQDWRRFPYLDPDLPAAYLPPSWPAAEASRLFTERYREWREASGRYWDAVVSAS
ncbi:MAG TPA: PaaX family transcriptional regulator C-terminal domain-containing protein [Streptosporangiaceae bacterium]